MKRLLTLIVVALFLVLVQAVVWPWMLPIVAKPDLVLALVVYLALVSSPLQGAFAVFLLGSWFDTLAGSHPGLHGVVFLLIYWTIRYFARRLNTESSILVLTMILLATLLQAALVVCFGFFAEAGRLWPLVFAELPFQLGLNLVSGFILLGLNRFGLSLQIYVPRAEGSS